jgi:rod shape-determining protein MreD
MRSYRFVRLVAAVLLTVWLQAYFFAAWRPLGVVPNLLLLVVIYAGLARNASETVAVAVTGGLALDLISGTDFGFRMGFYSMLALVVIVSRRSGADYDNIGIVLAAAVAGTVFYNLGIVLSMSKSLSGLPWMELVKVVLIEAGINIGLAVAGRHMILKFLKNQGQSGASKGGVINV